LADGSTEPLADDAGRDPVWKIPVLVASSTQVSSQAVVMDHKAQTFNISTAGAHDWVKLNAGQFALARVAYSAEMMRRLLPAISSKALGPVDRAALLTDAYALAKAGVGSVEAVFEVSQSVS
jgi:ERAP1-like C-terminal domain